MHILHTAEVHPKLSAGIQACTVTTAAQEDDGKDEDRLHAAVLGGTGQMARLADVGQATASHTGKGNTLGVGEAAGDVDQADEAEPVTC